MVWWGKKRNFFRSNIDIDWFSEKIIIIIEKTNKQKMNNTSDTTFVYLAILSMLFVFVDRNAAMKITMSQCLIVVVVVKLMMIFRRWQSTTTNIIRMKGVIILSSLFQTNIYRYCIWGKIDFNFWRNFQWRNVTKKNPNSDNNSTFD